MSILERIQARLTEKYTVGADLSVCPINIFYQAKPKIDHHPVEVRGIAPYFIFDLPPDLPLISTDQQKIARVLTSLLDNAIKLTDQGTISITVKLVEEAIEVCIADTGIGIAETEFSKIFMRFHQIENSLNRRFEGIGLGLSVVKGIVECLGGRVWVTSQLKKVANLILPYL